jgi:ATP-dependent DNA helicase RecQ
MAPETLIKEGTLEMLSTAEVACLAIDEAHCISEWGHDFRPEYRQLVSVRSRFPDMVCVALTATATPRVREDIKISLGFDASAGFIGSFNRENLNIRVIPKDTPLAQTLDFVRDHKDQSGIIYCMSRRQVDELSRVLEIKGFSVKPYHAGLSDRERMQNQELFIRDDVQIMVATIAFGMGINKPNVRYVVHYDLPKNIESYYQEIGRAGRDGLPSDCLLLFSYSDAFKVRYLLQGANQQKAKADADHLRAMINYAETDHCRRRELLQYFGETYKNDNCGSCDNCLGTGAKKEDLTIEAQKFLSCVKRTGEVFGMQYVIDVLRGSKAGKIEKFRHQELSTYGIGKDLSKRQWQYLAHQFLQQGLAAQEQEYGGLHLTRAGWDVLKGRQTVKGKKFSEKTAAPAVQKIDHAESDYDPELFELLRSRRKQLADEADVPPYVIFPDRTLTEMAAMFPQSKESLLAINGVGTLKLRKYGRTFLFLIQEYCRANGLEDRRAASTGNSAPPAVGKPQRKKRHQTIGELYNAGKTVADIQGMFNIKQITVLDHLFTYFQEGNPIQQESVIQASKLSARERKTVLKGFATLGTEFLSPVYSHLNCTVDYEELKILRLYYLHKSQN